MDETILNINVKKWTESIQFLKSQEIKQQLDPAEWTAVDELSNLWNKDFDRDDVKVTAAELVADLKRCENQHPNNLDIKKYSKQLTAVVREMLMKDRPTYEAFKLKLQTIYRRRRPTPPPPKPQPTPPPTPPAIGVCLSSTNSKHRIPKKTNTSREVVKSTFRVFIAQ